MLQKWKNRTFFNKRFTSEEEARGHFLWMRKPMNKIPNKDAEHGNMLSIPAERKKIKNIHQENASTQFR
jgi:hypothetical protein